MSALALVIAVSLSSSPAPRRLPPAGETAKLYFLAGDLAKAVEWASRGVKSDPKVCRPMLKALAEYGAMANHSDEFTPEQARDFIKWDRQISPSAPGKLTQPVIDRFVTAPLARASQLAETDVVAARDLVERVLLVDPKSPDALTLQKLVRGVTTSTGSEGRFK